MLAKERLMRCLVAAMSSVGENKVRLSRASGPANWSTAPLTFAFSNELRKTTSNLLTAMYNNNIKHREAAQLTAYLNTLDRRNRANFIKWVADECDVTRPVVYSWRYMCARIPEYAKAIIEKCAGREIFIDETDETDDTTQT